MKIFNSRYIGYCLILLVIGKFFLGLEKKVKGAGWQNTKNVPEMVYGIEESINKFLPYIEFDGFTTHKNYPFAKFLITNNTSNVFIFYGYDRESPIYRIEHFNLDSWKDARLGWCGNGVHSIEMLPGSSLPVFVNLHSNILLTRVGISIYQKNNNKNYIIWSEPVWPNN